MKTSAAEKGNHRYRWLIGALLILGLPILLWTTSKTSDTDRKISIPLPLLSTLRPEPQPLQGFSLTDQHGRRFSLDQLKGKWSFMFFGYTSCPDICPTTLNEMVGVSDLLAEQGLDKKMQFIFVSVDPQRDRIEQLRDYMAYFNPAFIGLTGSQAEIDTLTRQLNILAVREPSESPDEYQLSHTSSILLIDPQGRWFASFSPPINDQRIVQQFFLLRDYYRQTR